MRRGLLTMVGCVGIGTGCHATPASIPGMEPVSATTTAIGTGEDWPVWLGPNGNGASHEVEWSDHGRELWRRDVGLGYSACSVRGDRLYTFGHDAEAGQDVIWCLSTRTGEVHWSQRLDAELMAESHGGGTLTTPVLHGDRVIVSQRQGQVMAFAADTGEPIWRWKPDPGWTDFRPLYGHAASPVVVEDKVVVALSGAMVALDPADGSLLGQWGQPAEGAYATPAPLMRSGGTQLVMFHVDGVHVVDSNTWTTTAHLEWKLRSGGVRAATPLVLGDRIFAGASYNSGCQMLEISGNGLGSVWASRVLRTKMDSAVPVAGHLFGFDESVLKCVDLDGKEQWRERGLGMGALTAAGERLLILTGDGELIVANADPAGFQERSRVPVFDDGVCWTKPVLSHGRVYLRNSLGTLVCRDHTDSSTQSTVHPDNPDVAERPAAIELFATHVAATGGADAWRARRFLAMKGTLDVVGTRTRDCTAVAIYAAPDRFQLFADTGLAGVIRRGYDGEVGYWLDVTRGRRILEGPLLDEIATLGRMHHDLDVATLYTNLETTGRTRFAGRDCHVVEATTRAGAVRRFYFDVETGLMAGREAEGEHLVRLRDYRAFEGLLLPTRQVSVNPETGVEEIFVVTAVEFQPAGPDVMKTPDEVAELLLTPEQRAERLKQLLERYRDHAGVYVGTFGPFVDAPFEVRFKGDGLALLIPGRGAVALKPPDDEGRWNLVGMPGTSLVFDEADGSVTGLRLTFQGAEHTLPRKQGDSP